jgi:hypothetical protein
MPHICLIVLTKMQSASYSSTAGALPSPSSVAPPRHQLHSSSPPSVTSNTSMTFPTSMTATSTPMHQSHGSAGLGAMSAGLADSRLMMQQQSPHAQQHQHQYQQQQQQQQQQQYQQHIQLPAQHQSHSQHASQSAVGWHQPSNNYTTEPPMPSRMGSIDFNTLWETTNPHAPQGHQQQRIPSISQSLPHLWPQQDWKDYRTTQA